MKRSENRESFLLYKRFWDAIKFLTDVEKGQLLTSIFEYVIDGKLPENSSKIATAFFFIKIQLDLDSEKYSKVCERNKFNGSKGGRPQKKSKEPNGLLTEKKAINTQYPKPKKPDNDNDNEKDKENEESKPPLFENILEFFIKEIEKRNLNNNSEKEALKFFNFYKAKGFKIGKEKIEDYEAAVNLWLARSKPEFIKNNDEGSYEYH